VSGAQRVPPAERAEFFAAVDAASRKAVWCALATAGSGGPRVRVVHPTWEGETLWLATMTGSPKLRDLARDPRVEIQYQVAPPDFVHVVVRGRAAVVSDAAEKRRVWDVIDYDLGAFWPGGPGDPAYTLVRIQPERVELSRMFGTQDKRVWRGA
jgi:general stress protein 26